MAEFILINTVVVGRPTARPIYAGSRITPETYNINDILSAGGFLVQLPSPVVEAQALIARKRRTAGADARELDSLMLASVATSGINTVFSVFGRVGDIVPELDDYTADQVDNDSTVAGDSVADALDTLLAGNAARSTLEFGSNSIQGSTTTRFLAPGVLSSTASTILAESEMPVKRAGTLGSLVVRHLGTGGNGGDIVYTVLKNGSATSITVTVASGARGQTFDVTNTESTVQGDLVSIQATKAASVGANPGPIYASLELT